MKVALFFEFTEVGFQLPCRGYVAGRLVMIVLLFHGLGFLRFFLGRREISFFSVEISLSFLSRAKFFNISTKVILFPLQGYFVRSLHNKIYSDDMFDYSFPNIHYFDWESKINTVFGSFTYHVIEKNSFATISLAVRILQQSKKFCRSPLKL